MTQQTRLLCDTADMFAVSHSRHVCCVTQQNILLKGSSSGNKGPAEVPYLDLASGLAGTLSCSPDALS